MKSLAGQGDPLHQERKEANVPSIQKIPLMMKV